MIEIENEKYQAKIDVKGAQLTHLVNKKTKIDYIWNGLEWPKHAPVLFPAIGRSNEDSYKLQDKTYEMPQHGFASEQVFTVAQQTKDEVILSLRANNETKEMYPFDFELQIKYALQVTGMILSFTVFNKSQTVLPFSLGSHPAFNVPLDDAGEFDKFFLKFSGDFELPLKVEEIIKVPAPFRTGKTEYFADSNIIPLKHELFKDGLRIIRNPGIKKIKLFSEKTKQTVAITLNDFENVCLWTKEDENLSFLCIEPFNGLPDILGKTIDWYSKEGNLQIQPGKNKAMQYEIELD